MLPLSVTLNSVLCQKSASFLTYSEEYRQSNSCSKTQPGANSAHDSPCLAMSSSVVTAATVRAASPHVDTHVHVAFATGKSVTEIGPISGNLSRGDQILGLPPVVEEDAVAGVEEGPVLGVELVLVVERAAHVDGVIPD